LPLNMSWRPRRD